MRKVLLALILIVTANVCFSQEVWIGVDRLLTNESGSIISYSAKYETAITAGGKWNVNDNLGFSLTITHDTAKIGKWLLKHNFIDKVTYQYQYTKISPAVEFNLGKDFYALAGLPIFVSPNKDISNKMGYEVGLAWKKDFAKHFFFRSDVRFVHLQDFIVPVANVVFINISAGYKW